MSLRIRFTNKTDNEPGFALGEITLNEFVETFEAPLIFWGCDCYENQWREGIQRLLQGEPRSCLITSVIDSSDELFGAWWKLYREGNLVIVQNQLLLSSAFAKSFNPADPYSSIPQRLSVNAEREQISEWVLEFEKIKDTEVARL